MARLQWEELLVSMTHALPQPVNEETGSDGATVLVGGDPGEVVVRLSPSSAAVFEYSVELEGRTEPVVRPIRFGGIQWRRVDGGAALKILEALIATARESRRAKYLECRMCETLRPPEQMHADDECRVCSEGPEA